MLSSVEPIGMPGFEVAGVEALDCKDVALPVAKAPRHVVVTGPADPGSVAPVMIPTPLLSNSAVELDAPVNSALEFDVIALPKPGLEHAVDKPTPLEEPELTPGVASGVAPKGTPVGAPAVPEVLMPRGEVVPIPKLGLATPPIPELAVAPPSALTCA